MRKPAARCVAASLAGALAMFIVAGAARAAEPGAEDDGGPVMVFAAASMVGALEAAAVAFTEAEGTPVTTVFAASSRLARQIEAGAPAHVYVAANEMWMDYLFARGQMEAGSRVALAGNALVLVAPVGAGPDAIALEDARPIVEVLGERRLAMGDPDHVPAGAYARAALEALGLWPDIAARIAPMANVRAALAVVERGEVPLGIVYASDAAASERVRVVATFPAGSHPPIVYPGALVAGAPSAAVRFLDYLAGPDGARFFARHGFSEPVGGGA